MTQANPNEVYKTLRNKYDTAHQAIQKKISRVGLLRILVFLLGVVALYFTSQLSGWHVMVVALVFAASFILIVLWHARLHKYGDELARLLKINTNELKAMDGDYSGFDEGTEFLHPDHPFSADLDIFGRGSIFQYINRTSTSTGKIKLASWFSSPSQNVEEIKNRHKAIDDLKKRVLWRQKFQSVGIWLHDSIEDKNGTLQWMKMPEEFNSKAFLFLLWLIPALSIFMVAMLIMGNISFQIFMLYLFVPLGIAFSKAKSVMNKHELLSKKAELLEKYSRLITMIETENFESETLNKAKNDLTQTHNSGDALRQLSKIIHAFDSRLNIFAWVILNYFMLWDIFQSRRLEAWRRKYKNDVEEWFEILAYFDALGSLSCFWYNHPNFILPEAKEKQFILEATDCGHPLLKTKTRVDNPISFEGWKNFIIITGANMAGKSTYLRTVAVNFILAMTGAPVCARTFIFSPADIFTSIRTRDDLLQSESYFFAELKRLKAIIDSLESGSKLFIILDEILKGTNSKDKQEGSKALLKQLIRFDASGLIATHDLTLGELIREYPKNIRNNRFEVEIKNDDLDFDYKLKDGISQNLNATFLMKKMGITI